MASPGSAPPQWRVMVDDPCPGAWNMAVDHALALRSGQGVIRWYRWDAPTLSFGRNEPVAEAVRDRLQGGGALATVRRPTGGRAVLHHHELTYAVVVPRGWLSPPRGGRWSPKTVYAAVHTGIVDGLRSLGIPALVVQEGTVLPPGGGPCFQAAAPGEVALGEGKLVGSAQARIGGALLQHGSILLQGDQAPLDRIMGRVQGGRSASLEQAPVPLPSEDHLIRILAEGIIAALGGVARGGVMAPAEESTARELLPHYRDAAWTWRC